MDSILQGTAASIRVQFTVDGVATDPVGNVTVTVTRDDGTVLATGETATRIDVGEFGYTLDATQTAALGDVTAAWTGALAGATQTLTTRAEIVGGYYFTVAEFKQHYASDNQVQALDAATIAGARVTAEEIIERACNVAFVPRTKTLALSGSYSARIGIPLYKVREVTTATLDGTALDVADLTLSNSSVYYGGWTQGFGNVVLTVTHGYDAPPARIKDAAMLLTYHRAVKGPIDDRATAISTSEGAITLATPGLRGSVTGIPEVDAAIEQYALPEIRPLSVSLADPGNLYPPLSTL